MDNLDLLAARTAQMIIDKTKDNKSSDVDNVVTKTLGVLQENGVYAAALFTFTRPKKEEEIAATMRQQLMQFASKDILHVKVPPDQPKETLDFVTEQIAKDLDTLLLIKQVWEQTLIYARYGAKARG